VSNPELLYRQIGRLIADTPDFSGYGDLKADQLRWLGRARALVAALNDLVLIAEFDLAAKGMQGPLRAEVLQTVMRILYSALATAELKAPPSAQGAFIPAGSRFDAFAAITKVLQTATADVFVVDPYMDETVLRILRAITATISPDAVG
jgi:hypothetical protein